MKPLQAFVLIPATFQDSLILPVQRDQLPADWQQNPPRPSTQQIGDTWVDQEESAILRVPSAIVPGEFNYLFNPSHPDFDQIQIGSPQELTLDSRLLS